MHHALLLEQVSLGRTHPRGLLPTDLPAHAPTHASPMPPPPSASPRTGRPNVVLATAHAALRLAEEQHSWSSLVGAALTAVNWHMLHGPGHTWSMADVQPLLATAERAVKLCRRWCPHVGVDKAANTINVTQRLCQHLSADPAINLEALPSVSPVPRRGGGTIGSSSPLAKCAGCGGQTLAVKRCSACHAAAYCSTACQHSHWREHKAECWRLAAQRSTAAGAQS